MIPVVSARLVQLRLLFLREFEMPFDTKTVTLHEDDLGFLGEDGFDWSPSQVQDVIKHAFDQTEIGVQDNFRNFGVGEIVKGNDNSKAAFVETDSGYFIVSTDMMLHIIVTYSRWD